MFKTRSCRTATNRPHLSLHLPSRYGGLAVIARFELQDDRTWADVGNSHVGRRTREFWGGAESVKIKRVLHFEKVSSCKIYQQQLPLLVVQILQKCIPAVQLEFLYCKFNFPKRGLNWILKMLTHCAQPWIVNRECQLHCSHLDLWITSDILLFILELSK